MIAGGDCLSGWVGSEIDLEKANGSLLFFFIF